MVEEPASWYDHSTGVCCGDEWSIGKRTASEYLNLRKELPEVYYACMVGMCT